ncbi:MAG: ankyrin repeat domain-containing protein [Acidobacteriota bacterium]
MSSVGANKEPSGGVKFLVVALYLIGIVLQALIVYNHLGADVDLVAAAASGDSATVKSLLAQGVDVNVKDKDGKTALMYAAEKGYSDIVKSLLVQAVNVNAKDKDGKTALMYAADKGHTEVVELLKNAGATQ